MQQFKCFIGRLWPLVFGAPVKRRPGGPSRRLAGVLLAAVFVLVSCEVSPPRVRAPLRSEPPALLLSSIASGETALAKAKGESFDRKDGESVMAAIASALTLRLTEFQAMIPPQLEGLDAAGIEVIIGAELRKVREDLADLESELWTRVYANYIPTNTETPADPKVGGNRKSSAKS